MDLTPREINEKRFNDSFRGYKQEQVDLFLDEVAVSFERVFTENQTLHHRIKSLEEQLSEARTAEDMLKRMLVTAQKTANEAVEAAETQAQNMIMGAEARARLMNDEARASSNEILAKAADHLQQARSTVESLRAFDTAHREKLQRSMEEQLKMLDNLEAFPSSLAEPSEIVIPSLEDAETQQTMPEETIVSEPPDDDQPSNNEQFWGE
ncbi:MAG: DivIVA domain-containing protein [Actinomycetota bacterium]